MQKYYESFKKKAPIKEETEVLEEQSNEVEGFEMTIDDITLEQSEEEECDIIEIESPTQLKQDLKPAFVKKIEEKSE